MSNQLRSDSNPRRRRRLVNWIPAAACLLLTTGLQAQAPPEKEAPDILRQLSDSFEALARRVSPAVVQILVTGFGPVEEQEGTNTALLGKQHITGSGVINAVAIARSSSTGPKPVTTICTTAGETRLASASTESLNRRRMSGASFSGGAWA